MKILFVLLIPLFAFADNGYQEFHQRRMAQKCPQTSAPECMRQYVGDSCVTIDYDIGAEVHFGYCAPVGYPDDSGDTSCYCAWPR